MQDKIIQLNKNLPSLSIGVPAYNQGSYLKSTIESLLNQSILPAEIVISDNWSTDNTADIAKSFGNKVRLIKPSSHMSMMAHWNFVVENLQSSWFSLLSSDDEAKPNFVATMLDGIKSHNNSVLVRSGYENIDGDGNILEKRYILSVKKRCKPPLTFYEQLQGPKVNFSAFAVRKNSWKQVGGFPETLNLFGDWGFWLLISHLGEFIYQHEIVSRYRTEYRPTLRMDRLIASVQDEVAIYQEIIPKALLQIDQPDITKVQKASKSRCLQNLTSASLLNIAEPDRVAVIDILRPWAEATQLFDVLLRVQAGEKLPVIDRPNYLRALLRRVYHQIRSF